MRYMNQKTEPKNLIETVPLKGYEPSQEKNLIITGMTSSHL